MALDSKIIISHRTLTRLIIQTWWLKANGLRRLPYPRSSRHSIGVLERNAIVGYRALSVFRPLKSGLIEPVPASKVGIREARAADRHRSLQCWPCCLRSACGRGLQNVRHLLSIGPRRRRDVLRREKWYG